MRIDAGVPLSVFLFAHQDDEFGVFFQLERERLAGRRVCCIFVTDGGATSCPGYSRCRVPGRPAAARGRG